MLVMPIILGNRIADIYTYIFYLRNLLLNMDPGVSQAWDNTVAEYLPPWHSWRRGGADSSQHYSKRSTNIGARGMGAVEIIRHAYHSYLL